MILYGSSRKHGFENNLPTLAVSDARIILHPCTYSNNAREGKAFRRDWWLSMHKNFGTHAPVRRHLGGQRIPPRKLARFAREGTQSTGAWDRKTFREGSYRRGCFSEGTGATSIQKKGVGVTKRILTYFDAFLTDVVCQFAADFLFEGTNAVEFL